MRTCASPQRDEISGSWTIPRWEAFERKREAIERETMRLRSTYLGARHVPPEAALRVLGQPIDAREHSLEALLRRPQVSSERCAAGCRPATDDPKVAEQVEIQAKYHGYIDRQRGEIARYRNSEEIPMPDDLDYRTVRGLSVEVGEKASTCTARKRWVRLRASRASPRPRSRSCSCT